MKRCSSYERCLYETAFEADGVELTARKQRAKFERLAELECCDHVYLRFEMEVRMGIWAGKACRFHWRKIDHLDVVIDADAAAAAAGTPSCVGLERFGQKRKPLRMRKKVAMI